MGQVLEVLVGGHLQRQHLLAVMVEITLSQGCLKLQQEHWVAGQAAQLHQLTFHHWL
jgi:hypothetical protein